MESDGTISKLKLKNTAILLTYVLFVAGYTSAGEPVPTQYLDIPAPMLSQWNTDNVLTIDDTVDGFTGATAKSYIYDSKEAADLAATEEGVWGTDSVAYITWELDNGSGRAPGLQILNDNLDYKYHNCVMASGEWENPAFPDTMVSKACNDPQGSSKRYFLQLTQTETPIDLVFDLGVKDIRYKGLKDSSEEGQGNSTSKENTIEDFREAYGIGRVYRVMQKIKNDTDKRIVSYKFELGTGIGDQFQELNFEEHGVGFEMLPFLPREFFDGLSGAAPDVDIWVADRFATFSPKMYDDGERARFSPGFLDHDAAGFMVPEYTADTNGKSQYIDSGLSVDIDTGIIGSISENFFSINDTHDLNLPFDMFGYMLPDSKVPSIIAYWLENDMTAESDGVMAIWDGYNWRSGRAGLDGDPETTADNFAIVPDDVLAEWAEKPLGLDIPFEEPSEVIRYAVILSDDIAGINTDIFIHVDEKLLNDDAQPIFDSLTLRVTAISVEGLNISGIRGSEEPAWLEGGTIAPHLSTYKIPDDVLDAINDYFITDKQTPITIDLLDNDVITGVPEAPLVTSIEIMDGPFNGIASVNDDFTITYTPADYFTGFEILKYQFNTEEDTSNEASVRIAVNPEEILGAPVANNENEITLQGEPLTIDVLANDEYTEGSLNVLSLSITNEPANGDAYVNDSLEIVYTSIAAFSGIDQFTYTVTEDGKESNTAVITVRVDEPILEEDVSEEQTTSDSSSGGGCTMGDPSAPKDPTLPLLVVMSIIGLLIRRNNQKN